MSSTSIDHFVGLHAAPGAACARSSSLAAAADQDAGAQARQRRDSTQGKLDRIAAALNVAPFDDRAARAYGALRAQLQSAGTPIGPLDTLIAAHALSLSLTLVTNNVREFRQIPGLRVENWVPG